jgi:hypothetical protein
LDPPVPGEIIERYKILGPDDVPGGQSVISFLAEIAADSNLGRQRQEGFMFGDL